MYTKISPLGPRPGIGTFETFSDPEKYKTAAEGLAQNDVAVVDFVTKDDVIYFQAYHTKQPDKFTYERLQIQRFPFGIDMMDDATACKMANTLLAANK